MTAAAPCVLCLTRGGSLQANTHRPARVSLARFGVAGVACYACYVAARYRATHGLDPATGERNPSELKGA